MKFDLYRPNTFTVMKMLDTVAKRAFTNEQKRAFKKKSGWERYRYVLNVLEYSTPLLEVVSGGIDAGCHRLEYLWKARNGGARRIIFPASASELARIEKSSFKNLVTSTLPNTYFSVATPKGYGVPPFFAAFYDAFDIDEANVAMREATGLSDDLMPDIGFKGSNRVFCVMVSHKEVLDGVVGYSYSVNNVAEHKIPALLESKSIDDWLKVEGADQTLVGGEALSREEQEQVWRLARLAVNVMMYQVVFPHKLRKGPPPTVAREAMGKQIVDSVFAGGKVSGEEGVVDVGYHMRCLVDERYYRDDQWADKPRGSRWVPVEAHVKGGRSEVLKS